MCHWNDLNGDQMATRTNSKSQTTPATGTDALGYERELFAMADKLRGNMEPSDYKHVALGLIFLKYISESFEALHAKLLEEDPDYAEERDEYIAENVFWVPKNARWSYLKDNAKSERIGVKVAMACAFTSFERLIANRTSFRVGSHNFKNMIHKRV